MRKIDDDLFGYLCARIPVKQEKLITVEARKLLIMFDAATNAIMESGENNHGKWVEKIQKVADGNPGHPWCMYKNQAALACVERVYGIRSKILASGHCMSVYRQAVKDGMDVAFGSEQPGDWAIWRSVGSDSGHTGMVMMVLEPGEVMMTNEGNTGPGGMSRDGDGCYIRLRSYKREGKLELVGFIRPLKN